MPLLEKWPEIMAHKNEIREGKYWAFVCYGRIGAASVLQVVRACCNADLWFNYFSFHMEFKGNPESHKVCFVTIKKTPNTKSLDAGLSFLFSMLGNEFPLYVFNEGPESADRTQRVRQLVLNFLYNEDEGAFTPYERCPEMN